MSENKSPILVTGGAGYIASWIVKYLLEEGQSVRATVRSLKDSKKISHLQRMADAHPGKLSLYEADLLIENSFDQAMSEKGGCEIVIHAASPFLTEGIKDPQKQLIEPALMGTKNVLGSANRTVSVKRVVLTSSVASIMGDGIDAERADDKTLNESYWNESSNLKHQPYSYSKTIAEKEAWEIQKKQDRWKLTTINPSFVLGPSLSDRADGASVSFMISMVNGKLAMGVPDLWFGIVDVRDVARAHVLAALKSSASGRHITSAKVLPILEIGKILRDHFGNKYHIPSIRLPIFLAYLIGPIFGLSWDFVSRNVGKSFNLDNSYSKNDLGLVYRPISETLISHIDQLAEAKLI